MCFFHDYPNSMETASGIILSVLSTGFCAAVGWALINTIQNSKKITALETGLSGIQHDTTEIKTSIKNLNDRLDIFLKDELDILKDIAKGQ